MNSQRQITSKGPEAKIVLMVEDDICISEIFRIVLESGGYEVINAVNGIEALDFLHTRQAPAVILLDMMMPLMNGREFLEARDKEKMLRDIPVIVSSGNNYGFLHQNTSYVQKPVDLSSLLQAVDKACHEGPSDPLENVVIYRGA